MTEQETKDALERIAQGAARVAAEMGIRAAVCIVAIESNDVRAFTSPFDGEAIEGVAVAQQLRAQSRILWQQAREAA